MIYDLCCSRILLNESNDTDVVEGMMTMALVSVRWEPNISL